MAQKTVSADLSNSPGLSVWFEKFKTASGLNNSEIIRDALNYYRASTGPEFELLKKRVDQLSGRLIALEFAGKRS